MSYDNAMQRGDLGSLIQPEYYDGIFQNAVAASNVLSLATRLPNMSAAQENLPVLSNLPQAYFLDGDMSLLQMTKQEWDNKQIQAARLGVIVGIPESALDDARFPIWPQVMPRLGEAFGRAIDTAIITGAGAPSVNWPGNILAMIAAAIAAGAPAGHDVSLAGATNIYQAFLSETGCFSAIEQSGYMPSAVIALPSVRGKFRGLKDTQNRPFYLNPITDQGGGGAGYYLDGAPLIFAENAPFMSATALAIVAAWKKLVFSFRQDMRFKFLDQATITDNAGNVIYNFAQQEMAGIRVTMRFGWQVPNAVNLVQEVAEARCPFATLRA